MKFYPTVSENEKLLKTEINQADVKFFRFNAGKRDCLVVYQDSLTDKAKLGELVLKPLSSISSRLGAEKICECILSPTAEIIDSVEDGVKEITSGYTLVIVQKCTSAIKVDLSNFTARAVSEPPTSAVVKGPREGFTENVKTNIGLLLRRLKTEKLQIVNLTVGRYTKTNVAVCFLSSVADDKIAKTVISRIKKINVDGVIDSSYVAKFIIERKTSLFKQVGNTEKPDVFTAKLLEGRVGILVDGSPIAVTVPYLFFEDFQSSEDYFQSTYRANMSRVLRLISILIAIFLPSAFVSAQLFHLQIIPLNFLLTIVNSIKGIPLSPSFEMFFTLLIFEILNEASIRMPKYVGMALSIVGALVLGDTAVRAGIVSTPTIMIMALSGICLYTVPELVDSMSFLRLVYLLVAGSVGGYGLILLSCFLLVYLTSLENFDVPFLAPFAPLEKEDLKDSLYMTFLDKMKKRPLSLKPKNKIRMKNDERF